MLHFQRVTNFCKGPGMTTMKPPALMKFYDRLLQRLCAVMLSHFSLKKFIRLSVKIPVVSQPPYSAFEDGTACLTVSPFELQPLSTTRKFHRRNCGLRQGGFGMLSAVCIR